MSSSPVSSTDVAPRRQQARAEETRRSLLDAAVTEFADKGFDATSTRAIARAAGSHQPQINYHFDSKEALWRAALDHLFERFDELLARRRAPVDPGAGPRDQLASFIRALVYAAAELPELHRIMVREATADSERLRWIIEHHTGHRFAGLVKAWRAVQASGEATPMDETVFHYSLIGATTLAYVNAPEARVLGRDPSTEDFVAAHADAVVRMFLPEAIR